MDVPIQQTEQSKDDNTTQKQSTSKESEIEPATEKKSVADSSQMKGSTPVAILGNIVDYPITPESSEDDQLEVDSVSLVNKEKETEAQAQNEENTCEDTKPDSVEGQQSKEESVEHSVEPNQETSVADKVSESIETTETSEEVSAGDTVSKYVNSDSDSHETEPAKDYQSGSKDDSEKVSESTEQTPSCEKEEEKESETKSSSVHGDNEVDDIEEVLLVEEPVERRKAGSELETETAVDDAETASQGSAEFQPQIDEKTESEVMDDTKNEVSLVPESEGKSDMDKETLLDTKPECMDVDGDESNQDVTMETEAVAAPAAGTDAEDGDSLLPDTDGEVKRPVSKPSSFPITEAFLDENSLSLDCVLAISSTVPEGETSVDISLGGSINAYSKDSKDCPTPAKRSRPGSVMSGVEPDPDLDDDG